MYRYRYINKLSQFGRTNCTLILDDLEGKMPSIRLEKEFGMPLEHLDEETLYVEASKEIKNAQQAYDDQLAVLASEEVSVGDE
jgi:hypothetical protein